MMCQRAAVVFKADRRLMLGGAVLRTEAVDTRPYVRRVAVGIPFPEISPDQRRAMGLVPSLKKSLVELGLQAWVRTVARGRGVGGGATVVGVTKLGKDQRLAGFRGEIFEILDRRFVADHRVGARIVRRRRRVEPAS